MIVQFNTEYKQLIKKQLFSKFFVNKIYLKKKTMNLYAL